MRLTKCTVSLFGFFFIFSIISGSSAATPPTIDGFKIGDSITVAVAKYGVPSEKPKSVTTNYGFEDDNESITTATYRWGKIGVEIGVCINEKYPIEKGIISSITVKSPFQGKTDKDISIGSDRTDVLKKYGKPTNYFSNTITWEMPTFEIFRVQFSRNKVSEIEMSIVECPPMP